LRDKHLAMHTRRHLLLGALLTAGAPAFAAHGAARPRIVTVLGDSITAGLGLPAAQALPARLEGEIARLGAPARVRGAGVSGDTTAGGLARVDFSVQPDTDICVVALGGNDLLQGLDPRTMRANLDRIIVRLQARHIAVGLDGLKPPPALGPSYAHDFAAVFPALARTHRIPLYPDLMAGIGPALRQQDGLHPNAQGAALIAKGLAPVVVRSLAARRS
jgi:acyl-CoA thioesterase-1